MREVHKQKRKMLRQINKNFKVFKKIPRRTLHWFCCRLESGSKSLERRLLKQGNGSECPQGPRHCIEVRLPESSEELLCLAWLFAQMWPKSGPADVQ